MSERQLVRSVLTCLGQMGDVHAMRMNAGQLVLGKGESRRVMRAGEPGTPDILVMLPKGRVLWIECKAGKGKVSATQVRWHLAARKMGHRVVVVWNLGGAIAAVTCAVDDIQEGKF